MQNQKFVLHCVRFALSLQDLIKKELMKQYLKLFIAAFTAVVGISMLTACGDDDNPTPEPSKEYTKGTFYFCYGTLESELDIAYFKFKFTYIDEKGNEKSQEVVASKKDFSENIPDPALQTHKDLKYFKYPIRISRLPSSVKCETQIILNKESLTKEKYDIAQTLFIYFQPDGSKLAQTWSTISSTRYTGVQADKVQSVLERLQKSTTKTFLIQKSGAVSL